MDWFTGCTHFGHDNIRGLAARPFQTVEEMDEALIAGWNSRVAVDDTVYHLGDFAWRDAAGYRSKLNGKIVQIAGNHDRKGRLQGYPSVPYLEETIMGIPLVMFHYPIEEWNGWYRGVIHLHCHTHETRKVTAKNRYNVTVEANDYAPVSLEAIVNALVEA